MRLALRLIVLLALAPTPPAQQDPPRHWPPAEIAFHLGAKVPAEVAWAAWHAGRKLRRDLVRELRVALRRFRGHDDDEGQLARLFVLDALLLLDTRLPGEELLPHAVGMLRVPTLLLAAKSPLVNTSYFRARFDAAGNDVEWQACGNLLAAQNAPGFAAACLQRCELLLRVDVSDGMPPNGRGVCAGACPDPGVPAGFPPFLEYRLRFDAAPAPGRAVAFLRDPLRMKPPAQSLPPITDPCASYRGWFAALGAVPAIAALATTPRDLAVRWTDPTRLQRDVAREARCFDAPFAGLVSELLRAHSLTADEAKAAHPNVALQLLDNRGDRSEPLPDPKDLLAPAR